MIRRPPRSPLFPSTTPFRSQGVVGGTPLTSLTASGLAINALNVSTVGNQSYTGALTLNGTNYTASSEAHSAAVQPPVQQATPVQLSEGNKTISSPTPL